VNAQILERSGGKTRCLTLLTNHDDLQVIVGYRQPGVAARIESPLQDIALNDQRPGQHTFGLSLRCRPDVHYPCTGTPSIRRLRWCEPRDARPGCLEHLLDTLLAGASSAVGTNGQAHQSTPTN
jgi:hypothetical protein